MISRCEPALRLQRAWTDEAADRSSGFTLMASCSARHTRFACVDLGLQTTVEPALGLEATAAELAAGCACAVPRRLSAPPDHLRPRSDRPPL